MESNSRTAIACERCRRLRKRCQPPRPCQACRDSGKLCEVRSKARPLRRESTARARQRNTSQASPSDAAASLQSRALAAQFTQDDVDPLLNPLCYKDRLNIVKGLVLDYAEQSLGYHLECDLTEPCLSLPAVPTSSLPRLEPSHLCQGDVTRWLASLNHNMKILRRMLPDDAQLLMLATLIRENLAEQHQRAVASMIDVQDSPTDEKILLFAILALGSLCSAEYTASRVFLEESRQLLDAYPGEATFNLCISVHIHHLCALITGTSNHARAIASLSVQIAHDLGMQEKKESPFQLDRLRLYLLIMMSDQYSAQTHGTRPAIDASKLPEDLFEPLIHQEPSVLPLLQIMKANNIALEALVDNDHSWDNLPQIEAAIGRYSILAQRPFGQHSSRCSFGELYGPLARLHMFWYRLLLRSPFLSHEASWVSSLSVCLHAAQSILSIYFEMTAPAVSMNASQQDTRDCDTWPWGLTEAVLPPTWRQVQRIMTASFIILLSFWKGESSTLEATRYTSMALILLRYQATRWGHALDGCKSTLQKLATLSELDLTRATKGLLSNVAAELLERSDFGETSNMPGNIFSLESRKSSEAGPRSGDCTSFVDRLFDGMIPDVYPEDLTMIYSLGE